MCLPRIVVLIYLRAPRTAWTSVGFFTDSLPSPPSRLPQEQADTIYGKELIIFEQSRHS